VAVTNEETKINGNQYLPFEDMIAKLDHEIDELRSKSAEDGNSAAEIRGLQKTQTRELKRIYSKLSAWQTVQVARHPQRPLLGDYLNLMVKDLRPLHGDRCFGDDQAIVTAFGHIGREKVLIVGQNKGRDTKEKIECNFGSPNPEGYRKALAKMKLAQKYGLPIVTLIDTPGAYPGIGAEERGQAQAIAVNLMEMSRLRVPIICIVIGEGGSGGALGIGVGDRMAMLEFAYYSVISPEGCAAILWHDGSQACNAAEALKLTSRDLFKLGLVDMVIPEPLGGAHRNIHNTIYNVEQYIIKTLRDLKRTKIDNLLENRYKKLRALGSELQKPGRDKARQVKAGAKDIVKPEIPERLSIKAQLRKVHETAEAEAVEFAQEKGDD
jgi:acetyl-CoA carboxylase carboxyl transferase subunit alpha